MNIQFFPNWVKKISFLIFLISAVISGGDDFMNGFYDGAKNSEQNTIYKNKYSQEIHFFETLVGDKTNLKKAAIISIIAMIIYIMSKEKYEDDYIKFLRLESFQVTFLTVVLFTLILYIARWNYKYGLGDSLTIFLLLYLIIFWIKKNRL